VIPAARLEEVAAQLEAALCAELGATVVTKRESFGHRGIAFAFDAVAAGASKLFELATLVSINPPLFGLPSGAQYLDDYATTIATEIALPAAWRAPAGAVTRLIVEPHEGVHVEQHKRGVEAGWWPRKVGHSVLYLCSIATDDAAEYLGHVEADAYATTECVRAWLTGGPRRPIAEIVDSRRRHYALRPAGAAVAEATLRSHYATMDDGGVPPVTVCRWTIAWLDEHAPDLRGQVSA